MGKKSYITRDEFGRGTCHIIHAETRGKAKHQAAGILGVGFIEARVERAPEFDQYDGRPSPRQLIENHEWWYECHACRRQTYEGTVDHYTDDGYPVCTDCEYTDEELVERWNEAHDVGVAVVAHLGARGHCDPVESRTRTEAQMLSGHTAVVWIEGHSSCVNLRNVDVSEEVDRE